MDKETMLAWLESGDETQRRHAKARLKAGFGPAPAVATPAPTPGQPIRIALPRAYVACDLRHPDPSGSGAVCGDDTLGSEFGTPRYELDDDGVGVIYHRVDPERCHRCWSARTQTTPPPGEPDGTDASRSQAAPGAR